MKVISQKAVKRSFFLLLTSYFLFLASPALAVCPVCTLAVGAGVGLARWLGVDDMISGVWIGGLIISISLWTENWLHGKNIRFRYDRVALIAGYYAVSIAPLYFKDIIGHPFNRICGIDKLILGIVAGSVGFYLGSIVHLKLKKKNNDRVYFPFQKVAFGLAPLVILSFVFYIISKCQ